MSAGTGPGVWQARRGCIDWVSPVSPREGLRGVTCVLLPLRYFRWPSVRKCVYCKKGL